MKITHAQSHLVTATQQIADAEAASSAPRAVTPETPFGPVGHRPATQGRSAPSSFLAGLGGGRLAAATAGLMLGFFAMTGAQAATPTDINYKRSDNGVAEYTVRCSDGTKKGISKKDGSFFSKPGGKGSAAKSQLAAAQKACKTVSKPATKSCDKGKKATRYDSKPTDVNYKRKTSSGAKQYSVRCSDGRKGTVTVGKGQKQLTEAKKFCKAN